MRRLISEIRTKGLKKVAYRSWKSLYSDLSKEALTWIKLVFSLKGFWIFIPAILSMVLVYCADAYNWPAILDKGNNEWLAIWLMGITTGVVLIRVLFFSRHLDIILFALAAAFLCREIHFVGTHKGIYIALTVIAIWATYWRNELFKDFASSTPLKITFACMFWAYTLAILIQRRAFRHIIPLEDKLHVPLEEVGENVSHTIFLCVALLLFTLKPDTKTTDMS